ncbi:MAG: SPASM domain-containing protein [Clostridia bacterium]|nr:SPASM domain-containing protein [Clostridia bacterium]
MCESFYLLNKYNEEKIFDFFAFLEGLGVQEVVLKEPIKTGRLLQDHHDGIYYITKKEKKVLLDLQKKANKKFKNLLITTELLFACKESFGCAAGLQHSAINTNGDLTPCDFCPISFGNVQEEPLNDLWIKMADTINIPFNDCLQMIIYPELVGQEIPLTPEKTYKIIDKYKNENVNFPDIYKDMQK